MGSLGILVVQVGYLTFFEEISNLVYLGKVCNFYHFSPLHWLGLLVVILMLKSEISSI